MKTIIDKNSMYLIPYIFDKFFKAILGVLALVDFNQLNVS